MSHPQTIRERLRYFLFMRKKKNVVENLLKKKKSIHG